MSSKSETYDIAIIGGGLAGLALSVQSAKAGYKTILFEKEKYPYHKVCGEYMSLESRGFLKQLGLPLDQMQLPLIKQLNVSSPDGTLFRQQLPLGGFGISRYTLDDALARLAIDAGVELREETKVNDVKFNNDLFTVFTSAGSCEASVVAGSFGKRSNLDIKWNRKFIQQKPGKLNNYIGVKYHIRINHPADLISLHNFKNGYCGISEIEAGKYCLCYLTTADNLKKSGNSIEQMEKEILFLNPHLQKIFTTAEFLYDVPVTISQISFDKKTLVENHLLMVGDAGGIISPLCGNGMSMALHGSKLAFENIHAYLQHNISRAEMEAGYTLQWKQQFAGRIKTGRVIQRFFGKNFLTNFFIKLLRLFPSLARPLIKQTHGSFY